MGALDSTLGSPGSISALRLLRAGTVASVESNKAAKKMDTKPKTASGAYNHSILAKPIVRMEKVIDKDGSQTMSKTWVSPLHREQEEYLAMKKRLRRVVPKSGLADWSFSEWFAHKVAVHEDELALEKERLCARLIRQSLGSTAVVNLTFGNRQLGYQHHGYGAVLSLATIWSVADRPGEFRAPWPSMSEMKWEGDDRMHTDMERFMALPRRCSNETIAWHMAPRVECHDFDQVWPVPNLLDLPCEIDDEEVKSQGLLTSAMFDAIQEA